MESLRELYRVGPGPSSSHTIAPKRALEEFMSRHKDATSFKVALYGSLALTGKGHLTDFILKKTASPLECEVVFDINEKITHPNTMDLFAYKGKEEIAKCRAYSLGGGKFSFEGETYFVDPQVFPFNNCSQIREALEKEHKTLLELVYSYDKDIKPHLEMVLDKMFECVNRGLNATGLIPGKLKLEKVASSIYKEAIAMGDDNPEKVKLLLTAYAYACSEENASGGEVITAPTCGSCGIVPSVLYYFYKHHNKEKCQLVDALAIGGVFGNLVKTNASISGAVGGCQAEVGTACSMAAAMAAYLFGLNLDQIEYASEVAMEHHLGLTCDPVLGYVQIPCIERNGVAALRAYDAAIYGRYISKFRKNRVSFDDVIDVMKETGDHIKQDYKETSLGGLAKKYLEKEEK